MDKRTATAIRYDPSLPAPFVVATGRGDLAVKLVDLARKAGVPIRNDRDLAERLLWLAPGDVIPEELYRPVAEVLLFLLDLKKNELNNGNDEKNFG
ncbi:MAG: flagellar biosynthesis protein FlhB [Spirochaetaceae bacterium]|nr:MAG: flagellar biosynthesis protein FlhB [Spirochaetaceae bacterium]